VAPLPAVHNGLRLFGRLRIRRGGRPFPGKDASQIVIDEIAGLQFTLFLVTPTAWHMLCGFLLFRFFDIIKPFPARLCEAKCPGVTVWWGTTSLLESTGMSCYSL